MAEGKISYASKIHSIQEDFGFSKRELKDAVIAHCTPRVVDLPTFHEKTTKEEKRFLKYASETEKRRRYRLAHWYLENYLPENEAWRIYMRFPEFDDLVDYACERANQVIQIMTIIVDPNPDLDEILPRTIIQPYDIPKERRKAFEAYCKKHPLKDLNKLEHRRMKFEESVRKERKKYYDRRRLRMYDPLFHNTPMDAKEMVRNIKRITRENEERVKEFNKLLGELCKDQAMSAEAMEKFNDYTKEVMDRQKTRMKDFMKRANVTPTPIEINVAN